MSEFSKFLQIALPCLQYSTRIALDAKNSADLKRDLDVLVKGTHDEISDECRELAQHYFNHAKLVQRELFGSDAFNYFLKIHQENFFENIKSVQGYYQMCTARLVEVEDGVAREVKTGNQIDYKLDFTPGKYMLEHLHQVPYLIDLLGKPRIQMLDDEKRAKIRDHLKRIDFTIGPLVKFSPGYYVWHWGVLCYRLGEDELDEAKKFL